MLIDLGIGFTWWTCKTGYNLIYYLIYGWQPSETQLLMIEMKKLNNKFDHLDTDL